MRHVWRPPSVCLTFWAWQGLGFLKKKAQIRKYKVQCMGFEITKGQRELSTERKEAICRIAAPTTKKQFLGVAGWCRLWIPNFGLIAKPLHAAVKGPEGVLEWPPECRKSFDKIKRKLMQASAVGLLNLRQPFQLYVHERQQSRKLTLAPPIAVLVPRAVSSLPENKGHHWISPSRLAKYQAVLLEQDDVVISLTSALNPATLLISEKRMKILLEKLHQETLGSRCISTNCQKTRHWARNAKPSRYNS
ncbi:hypothetical protein QYF61_017208 [Mycteria americana]|uniref:Uncharacterized protein n=1 Tax=Mycteria americana TaxID=33587 RepID=A0AAN7MIM8_MYCAM|nr:hypothetical protein QYF61_017208 [Mycteria americana]